MREHFETINHQRCIIETRHGELTSPGSFLAETIEPYQRLNVIIDAAVDQYWSTLGHFLRSSRSPRVNVFALRGGERCKTFFTLHRILRWLDQTSVARRSEPLLIIGGGALLDVGSLGASLYRRGIPFWRLPTTPLAATDAAIGLKTAVNLGRRKNLVGTFDLPERVIVDSTFFSTLSSRHIRSGLAEAIKIGLALNASLFCDLEEAHSEFVRTRLQTDRSIVFVEKSISTMLSQLRRDPYEQNAPNITDLGHSLSKMFEQVLRPRPSHGEAVALDIALTASYARAIGISSHDDVTRIFRLLDRVRLPLDRLDLNQSVIDSAFTDILRHRDGKPSFPIPIRPGFVETVTVDKSMMATLHQTHRTYIDEFRCHY